MTRSLPTVGVWVVLGALAAVFLLAGAAPDFGYVIPRRLTRLAAIVIGGICIAWSSIAFQTITENRILTPAIMGYEAIYLLLQALLVLVLGAGGPMLLGANGNFLLSVAVLLAYSLAIHAWLFRGGRNNVYFLLLAGLVMTIAIGTLTEVIQYSISPGEFALLQGYSLASFNRAEPAQLAIAAAILALVAVPVIRSLRTFDVVALGRDQAVSLGVDHQRFVRLHLGLIALLVAISTSLIGPTAFMGIFVANSAYVLARDHRHRNILSMGCMIAIALFLCAQLLVEHVFNYRTTVGILINLSCGLFFLALLVRRSERA
tara:strand:+ start:693 stop:1643 length:951 start_codon:yes stop_codon:yes gene_type:complete